MIKQAIVLAGGFGTRLQTVVQDVPKPMALINDRPFLDYQLNYLKSFGIEHIIFSVGYKHEHILNYFGDSFNGMRIDYAVEESPLGTGGGILNAFQFVKSGAALVVNGDTMFEVDLQDFSQKHNSKNAQISLALREIDDVSRYGVVETDANHRIIGFAEKGERKGQGKINGGIYIIEKHFFETNRFEQKFSMEKDAFERLYKEQAFYGFPYKSYFLDIGIPEDYKKAQNEFKKLGY
ncbi:MAG: D-glycero-D-manno-heptose 1-phosphate guanosyltransferase [Bacteroidetes bacterium]|nr:MAG: D-glycero-D-manno-heptose 1-phosphate guanosyltransferase [Bacteroidota bacterium]